MSSLSSDTKQAFGRMLVFLKTSQIEENVIYPFIAYANTLIVWTEAGLMIEGKRDRYKKEMDEAKKLFKQASHVMQHSDVDHMGWKREQIINLCFDIDSLVFPIAMKEGILVLNQEMINISTLGMMPQTQEQGQ